MMFIYKTAKFAPVWTNIVKCRPFLYTKPQLKMLFTRLQSYMIHMIT